MHRRTFLGLSAASAISATFRPSIAQQNGATIRIVFPFAPGGGGDALSRLIAEKITAATGRPVIVENRTGADGRLAIQHVKQAAPDGQTLLVTTGPTMWLYPLANPSLSYHPHRDFTPIARLARFEFCLATANSINVATVAELVAYLKANPEKAVYGVPGKGTIPHFAGVAFGRTMGVDLRIVTYRGGAPAILDLIGGQIPLVIGTLSDALQQHRAATIRIIATLGQTRTAALPDVPTMLESGYDLSGDAWYGLWGPANMAPDLVAKLNSAVTAALQDQSILPRLDAFGMLPAGSSPAELTAAMTSEAAKWDDIIKATGFKIE